jgi:hypothetical protein
LRQAQKALPADRNRAAGGGHRRGFSALSRQNRAKIPVRAIFSSVFLPKFITNIPARIINGLCLEYRFWL